NCNTAAFLAGGKYVKHVHLGCGNKRVLPGQAPEHKREEFVDGFRGLKMIGYTGFMCFECSCLGGNAGAVDEVPATLDYLRACWEDAKLS
ncbi:MAG: sugar phosphate isomerase/epimerase, partial [Planctomycetaceae bacterium]|nr:sugar phosphate isomerase/epimerase [Planctomycetaceae bacterium]